MTETERARLRTFLLGGGAVALAVITQLVSDSLQKVFSARGWLAWAGYGVTALLAVLALASLLASRPRPPRAPADRALRALAEQAEQQLIGLGSDCGGMAATEWFRANEAALRAAVFADEQPADGADDLARICDALDAWYARQRRGADLRLLGERQVALAKQAERRDLEEVAAARAATGYRLLGDLDRANGWLGESAAVAPRGRTASALYARRQVEWALQHLARADRAEPGPDRTEEVRAARDRLDEAANELPRADVDADVAVRIDLGLVCLYHRDPVGALEHLMQAAARAHQARNAGLHAHALELSGVAAWMQANQAEAQGWWEQARRLYTDIEDDEGAGRCLQHLGSAALHRGFPARAATLLEQSIWLRGERAGELAARHLATAREQLAGVGPQPAGRTPERHRPDPAALLRRLTRRLADALLGR